jgi:hypothetical protein
MRPPPPAANTCPRGVTAKAWKPIGDSACQLAPSSREIAVPASPTAMATCG